VGLSLFLGKAFLAGVLRAGQTELRSAPLDPLKPMPHMFDSFGIRLGLRPVD